MKILGLFLIIFVIACYASDIETDAIEGLDDDVNLYLILKGKDSIFHAETYSNDNEKLILNGMLMSLSPNYLQNDFHSEHLTLVVRALGFSTKPYYIIKNKKTKEEIWGMGKFHDEGYCKFLVSSGQEEECDKLDEQLKEWYKNAVVPKWKTFPPQSS